MTAEVAVLNREAVALAADSAATIGTAAGPKVFNSVDKIFPLSRHAPVAAMVYGNSDLLWVPWDTVFGAFRAHAEQKDFATLDEWLADLIAFIEGHRAMFPTEAQAQFARRTVGSYFEFILDNVLAEVKRHIETVGPVTSGQVKRIVSAVIGSHHAQWKDAEPTDGLLAGKETDVQKAHAKMVAEERLRVFYKSPLRPASARQLGQIASWLFTKQTPGGSRHPRMAGIVVAGYGANDYFPGLRALEVDGLVLDRLKFHLQEPVDISRENQASIVPFAQQEMIRSFMEGAHPQYVEVVAKQLFDAVVEYPDRVMDEATGLSNATKRKVRDAFESRSDEQLENIRRALEDEISFGHVAPILDVLEALPKDELAAMAESLVSLTSFRRKVTFGAETVGGPIDVAVISKSDGFVWISRKHYFVRDINPHHLEGKGRI